jgi:methyltransferase family protein
LKGWFADTLPAFLASHPEPISFIHIDCDVYEPGKLVLDTCRPRMRPGTLVLFDEHHGFRGWELGEHKALQDFAAEHQIAFEYVAFNRYSCLVRIGDPSN